MARIVIEVPIETLSKEDQDSVFRLSRANSVFARDVNGELWQVLDLTTDEDKDAEVVKTVDYDEAYGEDN